MKYFLIAIFMISSLFGAKVYQKEWEKGQTFSQYMKINNIPSNFLESISKEDRMYLLEIRNKYKFYELRDDNDLLLQALIPISVEMQIHIYKKENSNKYAFDVIPIVSKKREYYAKINIQNNPYTDTLKSIKQPEVAQRLSMVFRGDVDAKKLKKNDEIEFVYTQKTRLGRAYSLPKIEVARVTRKGKSKFIYVDENGIGYKDTAKKVSYTVTGKKKVTYTRRVPVSKKEGRFGMPLRHIRITSTFAYRRWHPILHRYRPHHGVDFGARRGTPIYAVNAGKVFFSGRLGGYGNVIKIRHKGGYVSLYAHQSRLRAKRGKWVKKGDIIGYVGSTGRSTGPHLHFGLMKNGRWIDPMKVLHKKSIKTSILKKFTKYEDVKIVKYRDVDIKKIEKERKKLMFYVDKNASTTIWDSDFPLVVHMNDKEKYLDEK